jgi:hypothetical protein
MRIPELYFVYEFSYPERMPELGGIVFYVGKGTKLTRMDAHFKEAAKGCICAKCEAIRLIWSLDLVVVRRIVFESRSESEVLNEERERIFRHQSPYLTNIVRTKNYIPERAPIRSARKHKIWEHSIEVKIPQCKCGQSKIECRICRQWYCGLCEQQMHRTCWNSPHIRYGAL